MALDSMVSVEEVDFDNSGGGGYTLAALAGRALTLSTPNGAAGESLINVLSGSHTISAALVLAAAGNLMNVTNPADCLTIAGSISGVGALTKTGSGTLLLGGSSSYTGATTISQGELVVNGCLSNSAVTVTGGTLGGTGYVGNVTVNGGGQIATGGSLGVLHVSGDLVLTASAAVNCELDASASGIGQLDVSGQATLNGAVREVRERIYALRRPEF